jgi:protein ImuB
MLWLCLHLPQLPLSALGLSPSPTPPGIVDQRGSQRWLITATGACEAGTPLSRALALHPELKVQVRRPEAEWHALESLGYWIYRYGQPVTAQIQDLAEPGRSPRALLWVEIGHSLALFGGLESLRSQICSELLELGHAAQLGIAATRGAAALLACAGHFDPVADCAALEEALAPLPLSVLHWPGEIRQSLSGVGFRRLGDLFDVPRDAFSKRFGVAHRLELDRLLGLAPEPCDTLVPPDTFRRRFELSAEVEEVERLQFPLKRLCTELQAYLRARDRGVRGVTLEVGHAGARQTRIHAQFIDPHREAGRIFDALRERLERDGLPLPARELRLLAEDFAEAVVPQSDLFDARAAHSQRWASAVERICARLGDARVWRPQGVDDHRPERAMRRADAGSAAGDVPVLPATPRPSFVLPEPWPIPAPDLPQRASFERIECGWWDGADMRRDYAIVDINGGRAWVYRDLESGTWRLQGWWS